MIGKKLHVVDIDVLLEAMDFYTGTVIDVHVFPLRDSEVLVVVQPSGVSNSFAELQLASEHSSPPIHCADMTFPPSRRNSPKLQNDFITPPDKNNDGGGGGGSGQIN